MRSIQSQAFSNYLRGNSVHLYIHNKTFLPSHLIQSRIGIIFLLFRLLDMKFVYLYFNPKIIAIWQETFP